MQTTGSNEGQSYRSEFSIAQAFEEIAALTPQATALVCAGSRWTYAELNRRANFIAAELKAAGVQKGDFVAVQLGRTPELIAALIGILKSGGAYMPVTASDPGARQMALLADARPTAVIADRNFTLQPGCSVLRIENLEGGIEQNPVAAAGGRDLCYLLFSSGSTGQPKGVMVEHRSVARLVRETNYAEFGPRHTFLHLAPLAFDASTFEIWGALLNGGTLAIMPEGPCSLRDIAHAITEYGVTTLWLTAGLFSAMVDQELDGLTKLEQLLTGGDVVSPQHAARFLAAAPHARLINGYGPTEGTTFTCCYTIPANHPAGLPIPIGAPISNTRVYIVDEEKNPLSEGQSGEILIGGDGVARGYLNSPELTAQKFIADPFSSDPRARLYCSGDLGRLMPGGVVEFLGRADSQVKLRGFRIELGEIEAVLVRHECIAQAAVMAVAGPTGEKQLNAFYVASQSVTAAALKQFLSAELPAHMIPVRLSELSALPLTPNGKVDRRALEQPALDAAGTERIVAGLWSEVLGVQVNDNGAAFFELGGSSLDFMRLHGKLADRFSRSIAIADLFRYPTVRSMAAFLAGVELPAAVSNSNMRHSGGIAIVGMAARLPGAKNVAEFWSNLTNGVESITFFEPGELESGAGADFVKAKPVLADADQFDAGYFGILPKEAEVIDPQQRVFLECCVEALDDAGCDPRRFSGNIGVFAGSSPNTYFLRQICSQPGFIDAYTSGFQVDNYATMLGAGPDFLTSRVAYKLNLTGPAIAMGTACSTSLVAIVQACESLLSGSSDAALAGGVSITFPQNRGYLYQEGGIVSPDGHCRAFDADAQGTIFGSGCGVVLLKRVEDADAAGDHIYAVVKGFGINNDGSGKAGFTAPSVEGQAAAIHSAHQMAGVKPESISYIETHGTATPLGDPIEIGGLSLAFGDCEGKRQFCGLGTAKTNVGHLDAAAGVTGLIKAALSVERACLPPTLHYRKPNPAIAFEKSPFYVVDRLTEWNTGSELRRAGVSAFGVGGTNAHIVLEQAPIVAAPVSETLPQLLTLSAKTATALDAATARLADALAGTDIADAAWTLQTGRSHWHHRRTVAGSSKAELIDALRNSKSQASGTAEKLPLLFAFPGQGAHQPEMGRDLYRDFAVYREAVDECAELLRPHVEGDIRETLFRADCAHRLEQTIGAQPALFVTGYALAKLWNHAGIKPAAMIGHSLGEFVAATVAGVFSLADALEAVAVRARLMQSLPGGVMLAVRLPEEELAAMLVDGVAIATINSPNACVAAGDKDAVSKLEDVLAAKGVAARRLRTSHAFHSPMMEPVVEPLGEVIAKFRLHAPSAPILSTITGEWMTPEQATSASYWTRHCVEPVRFSKAMRRLQSEKPWLLVEAGPGRTLTTLAHQHGVSPNAVRAVASIGDKEKLHGETPAFLAALGRVWINGAEPNWPAIHASTPNKVSLPAYPFEHKRYFIERKQNSHQLSEENFPTMTTTPAATAANPGRVDRLRGELLALFEDLSGLELQSSPADATFLELGFDSLFLTQVSQQVQNRYACKVRFADLLGELSTIAKLVAHIDSILPADVPAVAPAPAVSAVAVSAPGASPAVVNASLAAGSSIERLLQEQLRAFTELTAKQLDTVRGVPASFTAAAVPPAPVPVPPVAVPSTESPKFESFGPYKPIQKNITGTLTAQQETYIARFIERYSRKTAGSKEHTQTHRNVLADPRVASGFRAQWKEMVYPIVIARSSGSRLWDVDGNEYIDILNGFGVTMFGHAPEFVRDAIAEQLKHGFEIGPQTPLAGKVAQLLCEMTGNERATFCNTGSEAVMAAMRLARTVTGRNKIVYFTGDYHGAFDEVLVKRVGNGAPKSRPIAPGIPIEASANIIVLDYGKPDSLEYIRANASEIAGVIVEPVQSRHPALQPKAFLQELRSITKDAGTALIFDEVVTGFRTHPGGAQAIFDIRADLATYGKVIGGGLPVGVLAGCSRFMDALDGGTWNYGDASSPEAGVTFFAGTFVRHPLAMAAVWAVLNHLKTAGPALQEDLSRKTARLVAGINDIFETQAVPARVENFRSIFYFSFPAEQRLASLLYYHLRERGVHIQEGFPCFMTTAHSEQDIDKVIEAFRGSIADMQSGGLMPAPPVLASFECPLTEAQMEIRLSAQLGDEESCAFNEGFTVRMRGELNADGLQRAIAAIVARHEALRATLSPSGDRLLIHPTLKVQLPLTNLVSLTPGQQAERIEELKHEDACKPFDLMHGPLVRMQLARLSGQDHLLFVTAHHIICDGWSTAILLDEIGKLYTAYCNAGTVELPEPLHFSAYSQAADGNTNQKVEAYWVSEFAEPSPALELPLDRPRPALKSYRGATYVTTLSAASVMKMRKAGARQGSTLFSSLLSGFQVLLARLSGQTDIVVGIPSAGQAECGDNPLVGHCVNFLPIRIRIEEGATFAGVLSESRRKLLQAQEHSSYTYGTLVRKLALPRNPSRLPLIEVQFNLEKVGSRLAFHDLDATMEQNPKGFVNFDLFLNLVETGNGITVYCDYNADLFDQETVARWLRQYEALIETAATDLSAPIWEAALLDNSERDRVITQWNNNGAAYPPVCAHQLFSERAAATPDAPAVRLDTHSLTYRDLDRASNQLAHWLLGHGVKAGTLVGISLEPSINLLVSVLGIMKAGAAYLPLDPGYPADRLDYIRRDAGVSLVLNGANFPSIASMPDTSLPAPSTSALAYAIYTSGSTGKPKGVEIEHRALTNLLCSMQREPGITASDKLLAVTTLSFDIAGLELLLPLISGAEVVIAPRDVTRDGRCLSLLMRSAGITMMQATPTTWKMLVDAGWQGDSSLKMLCGGEELTRELATQLIKRGGELWNMYGPTETTIWSSTIRVAAEGAITIGRPIANTQFYILDARRSPVPEGVAGELWIGGDGLARGYRGQIQMTGERFIDNPFRPGERMYHTGDLARFLPNGEILCLGRVDRQVKIRGHRMELGEIEEALSAVTGLRDAAVIVREDQPGDRRLVAYVVPAAALDESAVRDQLARRLPAYMIPSHFVEMTTLPQTANRKTDRLALGRLPAPASNRKEEFRPPSTATEKALAAILEDVLRVDRIGLDDDFFSLGADSIHLFQIAARAANEGIALAPRDLLEHRTVACAAGKADSHHGRAAAKPAGIVAASRDAFRLKRSL